MPPRVRRVEKRKRREESVVHLLDRMAVTVEGTKRVVRRGWEHEKRRERAVHLAIKNTY